MAKREGDATKAIGYLRASKDSDQRLGIEAQRATIEAWAAREGVQVTAWHVDAGVSGASAIEARPGLLAALAALRGDGAGVLVVAKRDRVARDVVVAAMVDRAVAALGARVVSADGTGNGDSPADAFMRSILDAASAYERGLIRARTRAALAAKRARGEKLGGRAPFGQRVGDDGRTLVAEPAEQAVIAVVREMAAAGASQRKIAAQLAERGITGRTGAPLAQPQIQRILRVA